MRGFTLIELLVVLAISSLLMTLVGPVAFEQYERSQYLKEREQLLRILDHSRTQAFIFRNKITLEFDENNVRYNQGNIEKQWQFSRLYFDPQVLTINSNGFWQQATLYWQEQKRNWHIDLNPEPIQQQQLLIYPVVQREN